MEVEFSDVVEHSFSALLEDSERLGPLSREHVTDVASRRSLGAEQTAKLIRMLADADVLEPSVPYAAPATVQESDGWQARPEHLLTMREAMPRRLLDHRVLRPEEEVTLARRIQLGLKARESLRQGKEDPELQELVKDGDNARQVLIRHNIRLVREIAKVSLHAADSLEFEDLVQEGTLGLNRAAEKFDPERGFKFSTYATWWVRQFISRAIANTGSAIRLPVHVWDEARAITRYQREFETRNNRPPTLEEMAAGMAKDAGTIQAILDYAAPLVRLDAPLSDDEEGATLVSALVPPVPSVEDQVLDRLRSPRSRAVSRNCIGSTTCGGCGLWRAVSDCTDMRR